MGDGAVGLKFEDDGATAGASLLHDLMHVAVDEEEVVAVDDEAADAVGGGAVGDVADDHLLFLHLGDGVAVVLDDEDEGEGVDGSEVEALVEVALGGGALADVGDGDGVLTLEFGGPGEAGRDGDLGADGGGLGDDAQLLVVPVGGHLTTTGVGVGGLGEDVEHEFVDGHAEGEHDADVAVVGHGPVLARS